MKLGLLQQLAVDIGKWFPELQGRSVAVSEAAPTKQNIPGWPLVMISFANEITQQGRTGAVNLSQRNDVELVDTFVVEYWLKPNREVTVDQKAETPFWSFHNYEAIRNRLLSCLSGYLGPNNERIWYVGLTQETAEFAVILVFTFQSRYNWCEDAAVSDAAKIACGQMYPTDGMPITSKTFDVKICAPKSVCCPNPDCETKEEEDKCP